MNDNSALTGAVLLEAYWSTRDKDMLDLILPFVQYAIAKITAVNEPINIERVTTMVREEFGYEDIPESIIIKVLRRDREHIIKEKGNYVLAKGLDEISESFEKKATDCREKIERIGDQLYRYLTLHCKKIIPKDSQQAISFLQQFFKSFAIPVGLNWLEAEHKSSKNDEIQYFIAEFILECKEKSANEYNTIIELTKGFFLKSAIYLQVDNTDITKARYKGTAIFYDTPLLLRLLGYDSESKNKAAKELHDVLRSQGAEFYYFPQNEQEVNSILKAYQYSLVNKGLSTSSKTLEGLDIKKYKFDDVSRLRGRFTRDLNVLGVFYRDLPHYITTSSGAVDVSKIDISENEAREYVKNHTKHYTDDNLESDVSSALGIHRIRNGRISQSIERCGAVFVTANTDFTRAFNSFYRESIDSDRVMPVITAFDLSAITWVKGGKIASNIPEQELLINAYAALQPTPELFEKMGEVLKKMVSEGEMTEEDAILLRADRVNLKEFWKENTIAGRENDVNEDYIQALKKRQDSVLVNSTKKSLVEEYEKKADKERINRIDRARDEARKYSEKKYSAFLKWGKCLVIVIAILIFLICAFGIVVSFSNTNPPIIVVLLIVLAVMDVVSVGFTVMESERFVMKWIEKRARRYSDEIFERKMEEFSKVID